MEEDRKQQPIDTETSRVPQTGEEITLSKSRKILFRVILVLLPVIILLLIEAGLRIFNYGGNTDLFVLQKRGDVAEYVLNKDFTKRYFFQKGIQTPVPLSQTFSAEKSDSTYRIFCLGASTVQGFPYPPNGGFPAVLQNILSTLHPDKKIEVINCGITAITSYSVLDMSEEILDKYQPDLLVVYSGHNEFYGVFGQGSRLSLFENSTFLRLFLKLQHSKLFLLTRDIVNSVFGDDISDDPDLHRGSLMSIVAKDVNIRMDDEIIKSAGEVLGENIKAIIEEAKDNDTGILICSLASNKKDFAPFASLHPENFSVKDSIRWSELINKGRYLQSDNKYKEAIDAYRQALKIDPGYADVHYSLAQCYYRTGDFNSAKKHFNLASDLDVIRFRAPSSFNKILKEICAETNVPLVDIEKAFAESSEYGITGNEMILEHVHPNQKGYLEIGKSIAHVMSDNGMIKKSWDWSKVLPDKAYYAMSHLTVLDHEVINYTLSQLTSHWPFNANNKIEYERVGNEETEKLAKSLVTDGKSLVELHLDYGSMLQNKKQLNGALAEYQAALAIEPISETYNRIGRVYMIKTEIAFKDLKDFDAAYGFYTKSVSYFKEGLKLQPDNPELNFNLGLLYMLRNDKLEESGEQFKKVLTLEPGHEKSLRFLSEIYVRQNKLEEAKNTLTKAIELYPKRARFYTEYGLVLMQQRKLKEAKNYLEKAINIGNDLKAKYYIQQVNHELKKINN